MGVVIGVVNGWVVRRYIDILIINITFPYSTCISTFWLQHPNFFVHFKMCFFVLVYVIFAQ